MFWFSVLALGALFLCERRAPFRLVTKRHRWLIQGATIWAPEKEWGPHKRFPVLDFANKKITARYPDVPIGIFEACKKEFDLS